MDFLSSSEVLLKPTIMKVLSKIEEPIAHEGMIYREGYQVFAQQCLINTNKGEKIREAKILYMADEHDIDHMLSLTNGGTVAGEALVGGWAKAIQNISRQLGFSNQYFPTFQSFGATYIQDPIEIFKGLKNFAVPIYQSFYERHKDYLAFYNQIYIRFLQNSMEKSTSPTEVLIHIKTAPEMFSQLKELTDNILESFRKTLPENHKVQIPANFMESWEDTQAYKDFMNTRKFSVR